ncbi:B3 domain-containing protein REM6-like [Salvia miltiorrhiza]|uniref:B3 domain-containing protein REM6-like n=1 Tax=Salvia miltiorrhiza TaxID=226208 RepID=UPI0025AC7BA4|nr:B3 domain-containing protein REM6-like [Salvia miltiorrhiza]XP_057787539.1 B3 domain-containing protein REM6-like [Salvia miltiorrhiza]
MEKSKVGEEKWGDPDTRHSFYQIMWFQNLTELQIPTKFFNEHLASEEETERVTLRGPCGSWAAKMERRDDGVYLVQGWKDFVESHSLGRAEWAEFLYNGGMSFDVKIYGCNGWLKSYKKAASEEGTPSFTSSFPFFKHVMKGHNVGHKCTMLISKAFSRKHLSMSRQEMLLRDSDGVSWAVTAVVVSSGHLSLCGGWKAFTDAHSIKKGNTCIFELVEQKVMQVHILR